MRSRSSRGLRIPPEGEWRLESDIPKEPRKRPCNLMWEQTRYREVAATPSQRRAAIDFVEQCYTKQVAKLMERLEAGRN